MVHAYALGALSKGAVMAPSKVDGDVGSGEWVTPAPGSACLVGRD